MPLLTLSIDHDLSEGRERVSVLLPAVTPGSGGALDRRIASIAQDVQLAGMARSPWLTGSLAHAHAVEVAGGTIRLFIDPAAANRVTGGRPAEYGAHVHRRRPWLQETFESDVPRIVEHHLAGLAEDLEMVA
jgi:hypothetical protein